MGRYRAELTRLRLNCFQVYIGGEGPYAMQDQHEHNYNKFDTFLVHIAVTSKLPKISTTIAPLLLKQ